MMVIAPVELLVAEVTVAGAVVVDKPAAPVTAIVVKPLVPVKLAVSNDEPDRFKVRAAVSLNVMNDAVAPVDALMVTNWLLASVKVTLAAAVPLPLIANAKVVLVAAVEPPSVVCTVPLLTTPLNDTEFSAGELMVTLPLFVVETVVIVPANAVPAFLSFTVTAPVTTPDTAVAAVARAVWIAVTDVVAAPPVKVIAPPVMVLLTAPAKLAVTELTVPPVTVIAAAVAVVAAESTVSVTAIVPAVVVEPAVIVPAPVTPAIFIAMFRPPVTESVNAAAPATFNVTFCAVPATSATAPVPLIVIPVRDANGAAVVLMFIAVVPLLIVKFWTFVNDAPGGVSNAVVSAALPPSVKVKELVVPRPVN